MSRGKKNEDDPWIQRRFAGLLNRLICRGPNDGRIDFIEADFAFSSRSRTERGSPLRRYLDGEERPRAKSAWQLGQALNDVGVKWMNGLVMLYASGRLEDYVGVVMNFLHSNTEERGTASVEEVLLLRDLLNCMDDLLGVCTFDKHFEIVGLHVGVDYENYAKSKLRAILGSERQYDLEQDSFLRREDAKDRWLAFAEIAAEFDAAFDRWLQQERERKGSEKRHRGFDTRWMPEVMCGALAIAEARHLSLADRDLAVHRILGDWLNELSIDEENLESGS